MLVQYYLYVKNWMETTLRREEGQDLSEYAILLGIIAVLVVGAILAIGPQLTVIFQRLQEQLGSVVGS